MSIVISGNKNLKFIKSVYYQPVIPPPTPEKYLTIEALEDNFYISYTDDFYENGFAEEEIQQLCDESGWEYEKMQYSFDKINWYILEPYEPTPLINAGEKIYLKRRFITPGLFDMTNSTLTSILCDYQYNLSGNCNSILFGDGEGELFDGCFYMLFSRNEGLINISESFLPATTLADSCYYSMFQNCFSLVTAPELPATTLAQNCYSYMFENCTSLVTAPALHATTLAQSCYYYMFYRCSSLVTAPELPATTLANYCYDSMFSACTKLITTPALPATTLAQSCYSYMFYGCESLTTSPKLPATTLAQSCYSYMFYGTNVLPDCTNIDFTSESVVASGGLRGLFAGTNVTDEDLYNILPINPSTGKYWLPATTLAQSCYSYMFYDCTSLVTAPALPATTLAQSCYYYMFRSCKSLVTAPELPATTLAQNCYSYMFENCTSLVTAPALPATTLAQSCYGSMFYDCTSLVTAPELPATTLAQSCYSYMFYNCSKLNYIKALFTTTPVSSYTSNWVNRVSRTGTFVKNKDATWNVTGANGIPTGWTVQTA